MDQPVAVSYTHLLFQADGQDVRFEVLGLLVIAAPQNGSLRGHFRIKRFFRGKEARFIRRNVRGLVPVQGERDGCLLYTSIRFVRHFGKNSFKIMERVFVLEKGDLFFIDL